ncbi:MAG: DUF4433 domain-containing protein [Acidobacteria bacterium]|nr:DUF4433 domain-containing protein [Planctomycetota bacterium]MBE3133641.1 DUF4433 domain-containing protein [Acidobacteriota bacterium]
MFRSIGQARSGNLMERDELQELHYITLICNVASIMQHGILSHVRAQGVEHQSVAMQEIQDRRAPKSVPRGRPLHEYANLYICGRNPMLYTRLDQREQICILAVSTDILDLPGVVITDRNAGKDLPRFGAAPEGLRIVNRDLTFAEFWTSPDVIEYRRRKGAKCAEVLIPDQVDPRFIRGAYVSCEQAKANIEALNTGLEVRIDEHLFFLGGTRT